MTAEELIGAEMRRLMDQQAAAHAAEMGAMQARLEQMEAKLEQLKREPGPAGPPGERGADGRDGRDGRDGLISVEDMRSEVRSEVGHAEQRLSMKLQEEVAKQPIQRYRGVYQPGREYREGESVSVNGSMWVAMASTSERPGDGKTDWQLAVKKGRDGRDAKAVA